MQAYSRKYKKIRYHTRKQMFTSNLAKSLLMEHLFRNFCSHYFPTNEMNKNLRLYKLNNPVPSTMQFWGRQYINIIINEIILFLPPYFMFLISFLCQEHTLLYLKATLISQVNEQKYHIILVTL